MPAEHGALIEIEGCAALRFERTLAHPPERVWSALVEREHLARWHPTPICSTTASRRHATVPAGICASGHSRQPLSEATRPSEAPPSYPRAGAS
jgi:hypothetical protein